MKWGALLALNALCVGGLPTHAFMGLVVGYPLWVVALELAGTAVAAALLPYTSSKYEEQPRKGRHR